MFGQLAPMEAKIWCVRLFNVRIHKSLMIQLCWRNQWATKMRSYKLLATQKLPWWMIHKVLLSTIWNRFSTKIRINIPFEWRSISYHWLWGTLCESYNVFAYKQSVLFVMKCHQMKAKIICKQIVIVLLQLFWYCDGLRITFELYLFLVNL